jgi:hypothetical protein
MTRTATRKTRKTTRTETRTKTRMATRGVAVVTVIHRKMRIPTTMMVLMMKSDGYTRGD